MKTKFKDFLLYSLACIGALSLLISANNSTNDQLEHLSSSGKYQVIMGDAGLAALNNRTGKVKFFRIEKHSKQPGTDRTFWNEYLTLSLPSGKYQLLTLEGDYFLSILNVDTGAIINKYYNHEDNKWMDPRKIMVRDPLRLTH